MYRVAPVDFIYIVRFEGDDYEDHQEIYIDPAEARQSAGIHSKRTPAVIEKLHLGYCGGSEEWFDGKCIDQDWGMPEL